MNIRILDSWLREHLKTKAKAEDIAKILSLTSVSVGKLEKQGLDFVYDIEVTTNRVDLMSVAGIAKEASAVLSQNNISATLVPLKLSKINSSGEKFPIEIKNDPKLVNRICAVVMEVTVRKSPKIIQERLEASGIRCLNNLIDVTNYVMREIGHPAHVFDFDRLNTKTLTIRESKKGEMVKTLDDKTHALLGSDIVAANDKGEIVDLLGVMGTANSVVTDQTKRILFFIDNNNPKHIRNTSMSLAIRSEAAVLNEKGVDPNLAQDALHRGIDLFKEIADGKVVSQVLDIYPNRPKIKEIKVSFEKINKVLGQDIAQSKIKEILTSLGFSIKPNSEEIIVGIPSSRVNDMEIAEDVIEEIARVYGYDKLPSSLPAFFNSKPYKLANHFYFEQRVKNAFKYLGFTETYTSSLVSENLFEGPIEEAVKVKNPLSEDMLYLRSTLIPSLLSVVSENKTQVDIKIFEIANTYHKKSKKLPSEKLTLAAIIKKPEASFFQAKGIVEVVLEDIGITNLRFKEREEGIGADIYKGSENLGYIEVYDKDMLDFELDFEKILSQANLKKVFKPLSKFPPVIEDIAFEVKEGVSTEDIISEIKNKSNLVVEVSLLDEYGPNKTFHIIYQDPDKNLTTSETSKLREKIINSILHKYAKSVK